MSTRYLAAKLMRPALCGLLAAAAAVATTAPASAHGRSRVFFSFNAWAPPYYYYPPYYYPPAYYYPPPVVYAPMPAYGTVQPLPAAPASPPYQDSSGRTCREYQTTVQIDGQWQPGYGTACLQPDGTWRVIN